MLFRSLVSVLQPNAILRDKEGYNVRVGSYYPPKGGPQIRVNLDRLLNASLELGPYKTHIEYEKLHPFTDGNGRSGRALWAWQMRYFPLGFLHHWYYQSLGNS